MSIPNLLVKHCKQDAVYWGNPVNDGYGGFTYDIPVEIKCRWEDKKEVFYLSNGEQAISKSVIYVMQEVDIDSKFFLGTLGVIVPSPDSDGQDSQQLISDTGVITEVELDVDGKLNPRSVDAALIAKRIDRLPILNSTNFLIKVFLSEYGGM